MFRIRIKDTRTHVIGVVLKFSKSGVRTTSLITLEIFFTLPLNQLLSIGPLVYTYQVSSFVNFRIVKYFCLIAADKGR